MLPQRVSLEPFTASTPQPTPAPRRIVWPTYGNEKCVESLYGNRNVLATDFQGGYLNMGLWKHGGHGYVRAAENMVHAVCGAARIGRKSDVLSVACGTGTELLTMTERYSPRRVVGLDATWTNAEAAWRRLRTQAEAGTAEIRHGSATRLPWTGPQFSHVICVEGAQHFAPRERFFREAARVLGPGGVLGMTDVVFPRPARSAYERFLLGMLTRFWRVPEENRYDEDDYRTKLLSSGFKEASLRHVGAEVFPASLNERSRPETKRATRRFRGRTAAFASLLIAWCCHALFRRGMLEYVIVLAQK
jgi:erythromycin 3''-O-methyltransferase